MVLGAVLWAWLVPPLSLPHYLSIATLVVLLSIHFLVVVRLARRSSSISTSGRRSTRRRR